MFRRASFRILNFAFCLLLFSCAKKASDPVEAANAFFALLGKGDTHTAYDNASFAFQAQQSYGNFDATVKDLGLAEVGADWTRRVINEKEAALEGEATNKSGKKLPVSVKLVQESGDWKIYSLNAGGHGNITPTENKFSLVGKGAAFTDAFNKDLPTQAEIVALVRESLLKFNEAIQKKSFADFYDYVAVSWQSQLSEKRLQRAFQPFIDAQVNLADVAKVEPVFDQQPQVNSEGLLVANGYFPTQPYRVVFTLKYTYELPKWKLFGIDVNLVK